MSTLPPEDQALIAEKKQLDKLAITILGVLDQIRTKCVTIGERIEGARPARAGKVLTTIFGGDAPFVGSTQQGMIRDLIDQHKKFQTQYRVLEEDEGILPGHRLDKDSLFIGKTKRDIQEQVNFLIELYKKLEKGDNLLKPEEALEIRKLIVNTLMEAETPLGLSNLAATQLVECDSLDQVIEALEKELEGYSEPEDTLGPDADSGSSRPTSSPPTPRSRR